MFKHKAVLQSFRHVHILLTNSRRCSLSKYHFPARKVWVSAFRRFGESVSRLSMTNISANSKQKSECLEMYCAEVSETNICKNAIKWASFPCGFNIFVFVWKSLVSNFHCFAFCVVWNIILQKRTIVASKSFNICLF